MRKKNIFFPALLFVALLTNLSCMAQKKDNWTADQLMQPETLAKQITQNKKLPLILSVGPMAMIPHSVDIGMFTEEGVSDNFKKKLAGLPKDTSIVIYCGCCPFERCPNVRPAIEILKENGFSNFRLLNLATSIKADWIDKKYPIVE